jgi:hypothetical protein
MINRLRALAVYAEHVDTHDLFASLSRIERGLYHLSAECRRRYIAHRVEEARREMFEALRDVRREMMN